MLAASDLLISPVHYEGYGLNVHEAISYGVPAMVSAGAGIAERFPPELRELLIPEPDDAADLVARLLRWRAGMNYWKEATAPFARALRRRSWDDMAAQIAELVESIP